MTHEEWVDALKASPYRESLVGQGLTNSGKIMVELYTSADGGTWTLTFSDTSGRTCGLAAGDDWQTIVRTLGDPS